MLAHLTKEQLEEKQLAIFQEISNKNVGLEANLKKELQNVRENIKSTVIVERNKLEESIIDLKHIMNATVENLIKLGVGQEEIRNEIKNYKVRILNLTDNIQMALEILIKIQKNKIMKSYLTRMNFKFLKIPHLLNIQQQALKFPLVKSDCLLPHRLKLQRLQNQM